MDEQNELCSQKGTEDNYRLKSAVRLLALFAGALCAVLFSVALVFDFIPEKQIFEYGKGLFQSAIYLSLGLSALCFIFCGIALKKKARSEDAPFEPYYEYYTTDNMFVKVCRYACAVILLAQGGVRAYLFSVGGLLPHPSVVVTVLSVVLIFPLCLYFVPEISQKTAQGYKNAHLVYGAVGVFWFVIMVIYLYFDKTVVISSPYKLMCQITYIAQLLAIVEEIRLHTSCPAPRARLATLCFAFITSFGFNIGRVIMLISGNVCTVEDTVTVIIGTVLSLYFGERLVFYDEY